MNESDAQSKFTAWVRVNKYEKTMAFELKFARGNTAIALSSFQPQQLPSLYQAKHGCIYKKLSDADPSLKPFDGLQICNAEAWVVLCWHKERQGINAYWIDIDIWNAAVKTLERKSITQGLAATLAAKIINL